MAQVTLDDLAPPEKSTSVDDLAPPAEKPRTAADVAPGISGPAETVMHVGSEALSSIAAGAASAFELAVSPSGERAKNASEAASKVQSALTYQPRGETGQQMSKVVDTLLGLVGYGGEKAGEAVMGLTGSAGAGAGADVAVQSIPVLLGARSGLGAEAAEEAAANAARITARAAHYVETETPLKWNQLTDSFKSMLISIAKDAQDLKGLDPKAVEREARAQSLDVPVPMTRGQATRDPAQLTREENIRKSNAGKQLQEIEAEQNRALHANLDVLRGEVGKGSKVKTPGDVGTSVQGVTRRKLELLEKNKNDLYAKAEKDGETQAPVNLQPLKDWLAIPANARNAGFLKSAVEDYEQKAVAMGRVGRTGNVTINDLENIRKEAVANAMGPRSASTHYAGEAIGVIDDILDQSGGNVFRSARAANKSLKDEFERQGSIRKLSGEKANTTDRAVALEDTLDHVVIRGSNEDLAKVKQSLLTGDTRAMGARAWADLQAGAIDYLRGKAGGKRGIEGAEGERQFGGAFIDALHDLDRDGKLDTLFGPRVADRIRLLSKTVHDVRTGPTSRISGSDTVPRIISILEKAKHIPVVGHTARALVSGVAKLHEKGRAASEAESAARSPIAERASRNDKQDQSSRKLRRLGTIGGIGGSELTGESSGLGDSP